MIAAEEFFAHYISPNKMQSVFSIDSEHGYITDSFGDCCNCSGQPYFHNCSYDQAGAILKTIFGELRPRSTPVAASYKRIAQAPYFPSADVGMAAEGVAYVPAACHKNITACRIHVNYHGCVGPHPNAVANVARNAGFSEHAESNSIVLVFPAVRSVSVVNTRSSSGCSSVSR